MFSKYAVAAMLTLTGAAISMPANAVPTLRLTQRANIVTVADNSLNDSSTLPRVVSFAGPVGNFPVTTSTGLTKPILGSAAHPSIDVLSAQVSSPFSNAVIEIAFSDTDFSSPGPTITLPSLIGRTTTGSIRHQTFASLSNSLFSTDILISDSGVMGPGGFLLSDYATIAMQGDYSLTTIVTVTHGASSINSSFNATVEISEPTLISLTTLSGLLFIAGFSAQRRQRRRR